MNLRDVYYCLESSLRRVVEVSRPGMLKVIERLSRYLAEKPRVMKAFVLDLPTGYGKSTLSVVLAKAVKECLDIAERVLHVVPTRSLVRDLVMRARMKGIEAYGQYMGIEHSIKSPFFLMDLVFTTIDSYALNFFKIPVSESKYLLELYEEGKEPLGHFEIPRYAIYTAINVFDEYHLIAMPTRFDSKAVFKPLTTLITVLEVLAESAVPIIMETATHVKNFLELLKKYDIEVEYVGFDESMDRDFVESRRRQKIDTYILYTSGDSLVNDVLKRIEDLVNRGFRNICIVMNTVKRALMMYELLRQQYGDKVLLLHARFRNLDLDEKIRTLKEQQGIVVTTQVIEVGIDLDFDAMITELAPLPSLVQRLGRVCRDPSRECYAEVYIAVDRNELNNSFYTVYDARLTYRTLNALKSRGYKQVEHSCISVGIEWKLPFSHDNLVSYVDLAEEVYKDIDLSTYIDFQVKSQLRNIAKYYVFRSSDSMKILNELGGSFIRDESLVSIYLAPKCSDKMSLHDLEIFSLAIPLYAIVDESGIRFREDLLCVDRDSVLTVVSRGEIRMLMWLPIMEVLEALRKGMPFVRYGKRTYMVEYIVGRRERYDKDRGFV